MKSNSIKSILIRCDGSHEIGLGHVIRCLALAEKLKVEQNCTVHFAVRFDKLAVDLISEHGFDVFCADLTKPFEYYKWLSEIIKKTKAGILILDSRDGLSIADILNIKTNNIFVVTIDDIEEKRVACDLAFYPPIPQVKEMKWNHFTGKIYSGWEYVILRDEFSQPIRIKSPSQKRKLLISMGGSDPKSLTKRIVNLLVKNDNLFNIEILLGKGSNDKDYLIKICKGKTGFTIHENVPNVAEIMHECDLAVISFGVTAYELASLKVPAIYLCLTPDHSKSATAFVDAGFGVNLGVYDSVNDETIISLIDIYMLNESKIANMVNALAKVKTMNGASTIARTIIENNII